jgi:glycogen operon protein
MGVMLNGQTLDMVDELGTQLTDDTFLLLLNAHYESVEFVLPHGPANGRWQCVLDTANLSNPFKRTTGRSKMRLEGRSLVLLSERKPRTEPAVL